jgi:FAD/FMN-containing dehydrogenase
MERPTPDPVHTYLSWGRYFRFRHNAVQLHWLSDNLSFMQEGSGSFLPFGIGRSYGDSCLNENGTLIDTSRLNRFIAFDAENGTVRCEAGVTLANILQVIVPRGWFLPATPGTRYVTVAGAIANDVHGKNHHRSGTFGCHVTRFELVRSDGTRWICSPQENAALFRATIGGLGLTGLITWAEFRLRKITSPLIQGEEVRFGNLDEFFSLCKESDAGFEYTVAWTDCLAKGANLGRGIFIRGNHADETPDHPLARAKEGADPLIGIPIDAPNFMLNSLSVHAFNELYYRRMRSKSRTRLMRIDPFFYPLDAVHQWNRIYGKRGFFQYQFVIPEHNSAALKEIFHIIATSGMASFLAVVKKFGDVPSPGLMSFPAPGFTLALDFPNQGAKTMELFRRLDTIVFLSGGRLYPAKDGAMEAAAFQKSYPAWTTLAKIKDPKFSSSFWRRVTKT